MRSGSTSSANNRHSNSNNSNNTTRTGSIVSPAAAMSSGTSHRSSLFGKQRQQQQNGNNLQQVESDLHQENEAIMSALEADAERLKREAAYLRDEVHDQNRIIDVLHSTFGGATDGVTTSIRKIDQVMGRYGCKHTVYLAVGIVAFVLLMYYLFQHVHAASGTPQPS